MDDADMWARRPPRQRDPDEPHQGKYQHEKMRGGDKRTTFLNLSQALRVAPLEPQPTCLSRALDLATPAAPLPRGNWGAMQNRRQQWTMCPPRLFAKIDRDNACGPALEMFPEKLVVFTKDAQI
eukprot:7045562-Pyramimonas_sp.AAC.1